MHELIEDKDIRQIANLFKMLNDYSRLRILTLLAEEEMNVGTLVEKTNISQPTVSNHLRLLRAANLVQTSKEGKEVIYSLTDERIFILFTLALGHIKCDLK